ICERVENHGKAVETPIGKLPTLDALDLQGLDVSSADLHTLLRVDVEEWKKEVEDMANSLKQLGDKLPSALEKELNDLRQRLDAEETRRASHAGPPVAAR
ncbi:MAG TPA: phosphoenolpyruvate carboxykinase domain-containing protein, partial [Clostridia bacterium]|nr:phosphoenolpyruvate carboxykinase domain-containing protein [Clostridia bacterium]